MGTVWVEDPHALLARISAGEKRASASRKVTLTRDRYPGLESLLSRCAS